MKISNENIDIIIIKLTEDLMIWDTVISESTTKEEAISMLSYIQGLIDLRNALKEDEKIGGES